MGVLQCGQIDGVERSQKVIGEDGPQRSECMSRGEVEMALVRDL